MIFKNLWRRKIRSFLTILGIAIGVAAVVGLGAMAEGMMKNYGSVVGLRRDLLVSQANAIDVAFSSLDAELEGRLLVVPGVEEVDPGVYGWIVTEEMPYFLVFGYHPGSIAMDHYRIVEGKPVTGPKQIALGRRAADSLKKKSRRQLAHLRRALSDRWHLRNWSGAGRIRGNGGPGGRSDHHPEDP